eukprot:TRINITY_DN42392_c0_g1_i1.p1 TRINITY_DN42392_c0_g1~~TRINITY_DN42392_c0_g1_i1.p1  ORF type:complete len:381 (+),score=56.84 TRINITY_DN42392_c0_g1_i1:14-1156(+)
MPRKRPNLAPLQDKDVQREVGPMAQKLAKGEICENSVEKAKELDGVVATPIGEGNTQDRTPTPNTSRRLALKDIHFMNELGSGSFGKVYKAYVKTDQGEIKHIAVKKQLAGPNAEKEIQWLRKGIEERSHHHIIKTYNAFACNGEIWIVMEYMDKGSLGGLLKQNKGGKVPESVVAAVAQQTLSALNFLHSRKHVCLHRDIKPDNLLVKNSGQVKLADFGTAKECSTMGIGNTFCGTQTYMSPERLKGESHDSKGDIWSLGLVLAELGHGKYPFLAGADYMSFLNALKNVSNILDACHFSPTFLGFLKKALDPDPKQRSSARALLEHAFVSNVFSSENTSEETRKKSCSLVRNWVNSLPGSTPQASPGGSPSGASGGGFR